MADYRRTLPWQFELSHGGIANMTGIRKFGENPAPVKDTEEDMWDHGGSYTFSTGATPLYLNAESTGTIAGSYSVQGLDVNFDLQTQTAQLHASNGQTQQVVGSTAITWQRVFRVTNTGTVNATSAVYTALQTTMSTAGKPASSAIRAKIQADNNQTLMCVYTLPRNMHGMITQIRGSVSRTGGAATDRREALLGVWVREYGSVFAVKDKQGVSLAGGGLIVPYDYWEEIPEKSDILLRCTPFQDNVGVHGGFTLFSVQGY